MPPSIDITLLLEQAHRRLARGLDKALSEVGASAEQWRVLTASFFRRAGDWFSSPTSGSHCSDAFPSGLQSSTTPWP